jgi:RimJ/RimL family protein N-acetyltransferase
MCVIDVKPRIETRRLVLRAPEQRDARPLARYAADRDIARMTLRMPHPYATADADAFIAQVAAQDPASDNTFAIEHADEGFVGCIGIFRDKDPWPELGYWIAKPYWGRGFATEAVQGALDWAGRRWRRRAIAAGHFTDNPASGRVLVKAGFLYTGEVRKGFSRARRAEVSTRMMIWLA